MTKKKKKAKKIGKAVKAKVKVTKKVSAKKPHVAKKRQPKARRVAPKSNDPYDMFVGCGVTVLLLNEAFLVDVVINRVYPDVLKVTDRAGEVHLVSRSAIAICRLATGDETYKIVEDKSDTVFIPDPNALEYVPTQDECHA